MHENQSHSHQELVNAWFESESHRLWVFLRSRVGSEPDADDLTQAVYLKMVSGRFAEGTNLESWAFTIANHAICDHFRGKNRRAGTLNEADAPIDDNAATPLMQMMVNEESDQMSKILRECLSRLSQDEFVVVQARISGHDHAAIAIQNGWPTANRSEKTFHRAKRKLHDCIRSKRDANANS